MKCPKVSKNKVGERDGGMPDSSLKAELSLFDVIKKYTHLEVLELLETSKNLLLTQETVTD